MQLSLLSLLTALPGFAGKEGLLPGEGAGVDGQGADLASFEQWMSDNGLALDMQGAELPADMSAIDWLGDFVPNLVLAQGNANGARDPMEMLAALARGQGSLQQLEQLTLTREQSAQFADMVGKFLQRPDTAADLTEQQRGALNAMLAQLKQGAKSDTPQKLGDVLAGVDKVLPHTAGGKERAPVVGQIVKWLQQVLRESGAKAQAMAATNADADASGKEATPVLAPFPGDEDAPTETKDEEDGAGTEALMAGLAVVPQALPEEQAGAFGAPDEKAISALLADAEAAEAAEAALAAAQADEAVASEAAQAEAAEDAEAAQAKTKASLASVAFASLLEAVPAETSDTAVRPEMLQQVAKDIAGATKEGHFNDKGMRIFTAEHKTTGREDAVAPQTAMAVTAAEQTAQLAQADAPAGSPAGVHGIQGVALQTSSGSSAASATHTTHTAGVPKHPVAEQVQVGIKQIAKEGLDRITIQLSPEDMGRVDVRMDMGADGRAHIVFTVDKADAFEQLQRDARFLEKALQDAGVKADAGSMEFNLRQQHQPAFAQANAGGQDQGSGQPQWDEAGGAGNGGADAAGAVGEADADADAVDVAVRSYSVNVNNGLDIRV